MSLPDGAEVVLDGMLVVQVNGPYIFVRDPWPGCSLLPIYANAKLEKWWSVEVTGITKTISGKRIVVATRIRLYVDPKGTPFWLWPKSPQPREWPFMKELPIGISTMTEPTPPPEPEPPPPSSPPTPPEGSIAWAKFHGGDVTLTGKVVTAAFYRERTPEVDFFYIQEVPGPGQPYTGIRVDAPEFPPLQLGTGYVVNVSGAVAGGPECHVDATSVEIAGST